MDFANLQYAYAISGGIGSGKSSVCKILNAWGYEILDADLIAHMLLEKMSDLLIEEFGDEILEDGNLSRAGLGRIVFNDSLKLQRLNQILSPEIQKHLLKACLQLEEKKKIYFVEIALLFEQIEIYDFKHKILIACSRENQIKRVMERNALNLKEIESRIASQMPMDQKLCRADFILWNDCSKEELEQKVRELLKQILRIDNSRD